MDYNNNAYSEAKSFDTSYIEMRWNDALVNGARDYVNDVGPCDTDRTRYGKNFFDTLVPDYVSHYGELNGAVYVGPVLSAKDILVDLLATHQFNNDMKSAVYDEIGVACACNPNKELICAIAFGEDIIEHFVDSDVTAMDHVADRDECQRKCNFY